MEEEIRRANDLNGQLSQLKRKELQRIQSQAGSIRVSMVYLTMVQEAQNVVTYIINLMKVSRKFQLDTDMSLGCSSSKHTTIGFIFIKSFRMNQSMY